METILEKKRKQTVLRCVGMAENVLALVRVVPVDDALFHAVVELVHDLKSLSFYVHEKS